MTKGIVFVFAIAASVRECRASFWPRNSELSSLFGLRVSKVSTVTGMERVLVCNAELSSLLDLRLVLALQKRQQSQGSGGALLAECRTAATFGLAIGPRIPKVSTVAGMVGVLVAPRRTMVTFGLAFGPRVSKVSTVTEIGGGSRSRNAELSALLDLSLAFPFLKRQQSRGSGRSSSHSSRNAELSLLLDLPLE